MANRDIRRIINSKQDSLESTGNLSINSMSDGQVSISKSSSELLSISKKKYGRLYKSYMSSTGNQIVDRNLTINGNLKVKGIINKEVMIFYHPFNVTGTSKVYLPWSSISEAASINYYNNLIAPYSGRLLKVVARSEEALGSTVIGFHKASDGTESPSSTATEEITVNMSADDTSYTFDFTKTSSFNSGDVVAISINPTSTPNDSRVTSVWLFDILI
tara:strand:- start:49 stop:699 length:651 start_codon:yes stop_codon:yes gene_type:complete